MAVLGRLLIGSSERLDLADLLSIDSFTTADFKYLLQSFVGGTVPYILAGCDVNNPGNAIGTTSIAINIHNSVVYHPTAAAGPFFYGLEEGNTYAAPLVPELRKNTTNFVYLNFTTFDAAQDSRAFWDPDSDGGAGAEFSQDVNTESVLTVEVGVSVATFPAGTIPICKVTVGASVITSIQDCRNMLFRLGTGGVAPNPFSNYQFKALPDASYVRNEPSTTMASSNSPNCFQGGDKNILTLKEWMDVVMTKLKELGNTTYWYESAIGGGGSGGTALAASTNFLKSKGKWIHSDNTPGKVSFTEDIQSINLIDPRMIIFRASTKELDDNNVLYADLTSGDINDGNVFVEWVKDAAFVNAGKDVVGAFTNTSKGDWIKKKTDTSDKWVRIEQYFDGLSGGGSGDVAPNIAQSVVISRQYEGSSSVAGIGDATEYSKGVYSSFELQIADRGSAVFQSLLGDFFWLAARSDVIHNISAINSTTLTIDTISESDGIRARCYVASGHNLYDGYRITIGAGIYAGTYKVEVEDSTVFYINTDVIGDDSSVEAYWATVTCIERSSSTTLNYGIELESATHNLENDQSIIISGTSNYDGTYNICVPPSTIADYTKKIQIPISAFTATESTGNVTLPRMSVRDEFGITKIVQGQTTDIGDGTTDAIKSYIGMSNSMSDTGPDYYTSTSLTSYNAKDGMSNYNTDPADNLTIRAAKLTAMMADRIQDRGIIFDGITTITNTAGTDITATATLNIIKPGSSTQAVTLTTNGITANKAIVVKINRNGAAALTTSIETLDNAFLLEENKLILFYRLSGTDIYTWEGIKIPAGETHTYGERIRPRIYTEQDRTAKLISGGTWSWQASTGELRFTANAYLQVPGLSNARNTLDYSVLSPITMSSAGEVAYVAINRNTGIADDITPIITDISTVSLTEYDFIIARRIGNNVLIGESFLLKDNEYLELDGALAEINRHHGQLKIDQNFDTASDVVTVSAADITMLDGHTLTQEMNSFVMDWSGASINFTSGVVEGISDNFIPHLVADEYFWYGIGMIPDGVGIDNRMISKLLISKAANGDLVRGDAPLPLITGTKKLGSVLVKVNAGANAVEVIEIKRLGVGAGGSGGSGIVMADLYEPIATTLPTGASVTIDGASGVAGDLVLFSNLTNPVENNKIYELSVVEGNLVWSPWPSFNGLFDPIDGDRVGFKRGNAYAEQTAIFDGTNFLINDVIRLFNGPNGTDFWELGSLKTSILDDDTTDNIFTVNATGTENMIISYSLLRSTNKQTGDIYITHDGANTSISTTGTDIGNCGISFSADINAGNIRLRYTSTSTGNNATMKYFIKRWSDAAGGPTGVPNYTSATGSTVAAAGAPGDIQYKGGTGNLAGDARFNWDASTGLLNLNGLQYSGLSSAITLYDNNTLIAIDVPGASWTAATNRFILIEYSLDRDGDVQIGNIRIAHNGSITTINDDYTDTSPLGITFSAILSGSELKLQYISTSTGFNASFKYSIRKWI